MNDVKIFKSVLRFLGSSIVLAITLCSSAHAAWAPALSARQSQFESLSRRPLTEGEVSSLASAEVAAAEAQDHIASRTESRTSRWTTFVCLDIGISIFAGVEGLACLDQNNQAYWVSGFQIGNDGAIGAGVIVAHNYDGNSVEGKYLGPRTGGNSASLVNATFAIMFKDGFDSDKSPDDRLYVFGGRFGLTMPIVGEFLKVKKIL